MRKGIKLLRLFFLSSVFVLLADSCKKQDPLISEVPEISFVSLTPASVKEYSDSVVFTIHYRDGDGDLGENNSSVVNIFLKDSRNNVTYSYRIPQLAPDNTEIAIQGDLKVVLPNTYITDPSKSSETFYCEITVKDRAGHISNKVNSSIVTVSK